MRESTYAAKCCRAIRAKHKGVSSRQHTKRHRDHHLGQDAVDCSANMRWGAFGESPSKYALAKTGNRNMSGVEHQSLNGSHKKFRGEL